MSAYHRLAELTELSSIRALSPAESAELFRVHVAEDLRQSRLPARIMRLRAKLHAAEAALWPRYLPRLKDLEVAAEAARIAALERELGHAQPTSFHLATERNAS